MKRMVSALAGVSALCLATVAQAEISGGTVKIGVLTDMSGVYSDITGKGSIVATQMAVDLSSQLLTAQGSGADHIALANAGGDTVAGIKTARDFGIGQDKQKLVAFFLTAIDVKSVGLAAAQGTMLTEGFYWNLDDRTRALLGALQGHTHGAVPSAIQAGIYSSVRHRTKPLSRQGQCTCVGGVADHDVGTASRLRIEGFTSPQTGAFDEP